MATVGEILDRKGHDVVTIRPDQTLENALALLAEHGIGALVVQSEGRGVAGVISERDIARALATAGADALHDRVENQMTATVSTCNRKATADQIMATMTSSRFRHMPVVEDDELIGIVSIGDVVKSRIDELQLKAESLEEYITGSSY